VFCCSVHINR